MDITLRFKGNHPNQDDKIRRCVTAFAESLPATFAHLEVSCVQEKTVKDENPKMARPTGKDRPKSSSRGKKA